MLIYYSTNTIQAEDVETIWTKILNPLRLGYSQIWLGAKICSKSKFNMFRNKRRLKSLGTAYIQINESSTEDKLHPHKVNSIPPSTQNC